MNWRVAFGVVVRFFEIQILGDGLLPELKVGFLTGDPGNSKSFSYMRPLDFPVDVGISERVYCLAELVHPIPEHVDKATICVDRGLWNYFENVEIICYDLSPHTCRCAP